MVRTSREHSDTNTKKRVLKEFRLVLLDDSWRLILFVVDLILLMGFAGLVALHVEPAALSTLTGR